MSVYSEEVYADHGARAKDNLAAFVLNEIGHVFIALLIGAVPGALLGMLIEGKSGHDADITLGVLGVSFVVYVISTAIDHRNARRYAAALCEAREEARQRAHDMMMELAQVKRSAP